MDGSEEACQAFLDFLFSRLNAAFTDYLNDASRDDHARWWHENLQIEMVGSVIPLTISSYWYL